MATITVRPTGLFPDDRNNLQDAINNASSGDTVLLKATNVLGEFTPWNCGGSTPIDYETYGVHYSSDSNKQTFATRELLDENDNPDGGPILKHRSDQWLSRKIYINKDITILGELLNNDDGDYNYNDDLRLVEDWSEKRTLIDGAVFAIGLGTSNLHLEDSSEWGKPTVHFKKFEMQNCPGQYTIAGNTHELTFSRLVLRKGLVFPRGLDPTGISSSIASSDYNMTYLNLGATIPSPVVAKAGVYQIGGGTNFPINSGASEPGPVRFTANRCKIITPNHVTDTETISSAHSVQFDLGGGARFRDVSEIVDCEIIGNLFFGSACARGTNGAKLIIHRNKVLSYRGNDLVAPGPIRFDNNDSRISFGLFDLSSDVSPLDEFYRTERGLIDLEVDIYENTFHARWPVGTTTSILRVNNWELDESTGPRLKFRNNILISGPTKELSDGAAVARFISFNSLDTVFGYADMPCNNWDVTNNKCIGPYSQRGVSLFAGISEPEIKLSNLVITGNDLTEATPIGNAVDYFIRTITDTSIVAFDVQGLRPNTYNVVGLDNSTVVGSGISLS